MSNFVCPMCDEFFLTECYHEDPNEIDEDDDMEEAPCPCGCTQYNSAGDLIRVADCCW